MRRIDLRMFDALRQVTLIPGYSDFAEGSCFIEMGKTRVLCTASVSERVPQHVNEGCGWITAEYSMLPRANRERSGRDISKLKLSGRSAEIQRLIGRSLRTCVDLRKIGPYCITIDCDVLQGDGGTRMASVTGGFVALALAFKTMKANGMLVRVPEWKAVSGISAGIVQGQPMLDLCYEEDSSAEVDFNCVMTADGELVELQGTGEGRAFTSQELQELLSLCEKGCRELNVKQIVAIGE